MNSKFELGKDYIFKDNKIFTCCKFDKAANCIDFVYKNNITPKDNIFDFDGHYMPFIDLCIEGEYYNTYYTHIYDLAGKISSQLLSTDITPEQVLSGEILDMKLIISSSKEDGVVGEYWYDKVKDDYVQQVYPSIYVYQGIRTSKGELYSFFDTGKLTKATKTEIEQYLNKTKQMKTEFITPVSMECTEDQYLKYLKEPLKKMGYKEEDIADFPKFPILVNNYNGNLNYLGNISDYRKDKNNRYFIDNFNPELFLALASMTNNPEGNYGEYWIFYSKTIKSMWTNGKLYKQIGNLNDEKAFIDNTGRPNGMHPHNFDYFRKAAKEEIIKFFTKQQSKEVELKDGEYYYCEEEDGEEWIYIYKPGSDRTYRYASFAIDEIDVHYNGGYSITTDNSIKTLRLATPEEKNLLDNRLAEEGVYFDKETKTIKTIIKKEKIMKTFTITRLDMQKIHDIACSTWKKNIMDLTTKYATSPLSNVIILPEEEVEKMFNAAIPSQKETLNEVFPEYSISKDKNIFIKEATSTQTRNLEVALKSLIPNHRVEMINNAGDRINRPDLKYRGLFVDRNIKVIVHERDECSLIEFVEK